jgi:hypothetical protein
MAVWWIANAAISAYKSIAGAQLGFQKDRKASEKALETLNATPEELVGVVGGLRDKVGGLQRQIDDERGYHSRPLSANSASYKRYTKGKG